MRCSVGRRSVQGTQALLTACLLATTSACGSNPPQIPLPDTSAFASLVPTDAPSISVYVDGTESMLGFVQSPSRVPGNTTYQRVLPSGVDDAIQQVWPNALASGKISYFKFGTSVEPLDRNQQNQVPDWEAVGTDKFYSDSRVLSYTYIDQAVSHTETPGTNLRVIVTDLYQSDASLTPLLTSLTRESFAKELTIGFTGIRSGFSGRVFPETLGSTKGVQYDSSDDCGDAAGDGCLRPFYLISVGRHADVAAFQEAMRNELADLELDAGAYAPLHVTPEQSEGLQNVANSRATDLTNLVLLDNAAFRSPTPITERHFREFQRNPGDASLVLALDRSASPLVPAEPTVTVEQWNPADETWDESALAGVTASMNAENAGSTELTVEIPAGAMTGAGVSDAVYRMRISVAASESDLTAGEWVQAWSIDPAEVDANANNRDKANTVGPKTMNLARLVDGLWSARRDKATPQLARYDIYFHVP